MRGHNRPLILTENHTIKYEGEQKHDENKPGDSG